MNNFRLALAENKRVLLIFFLIALVIRLSFCFYFQQFYFGELTFKYKDTASYLDPILNFIEKGTYQGDLFVDDSKYFRVPVYPIFLGLIHTVFGAANFDHAVAVIQSLLDSVSVTFIFLIVLKISNSKSSAIISAVFYATYPFMLLWVPISYTESVQMFLIWGMILVTTYDSSSNFSLVIQGVLCGLMILTKQYLGLILLIPLANIAISNKFYNKKYASLIFLMLGTLIVLSPWVVRNYFQSGKIIILRGETTGLRSVGKDFEAFYKFAGLFNENVTPALYEVAYKGKMSFDKHPGFVNRNRTEIDSAVKLAYQCGDSFVQLRTWVPVTQVPYAGCGDEVGVAFSHLTDKFWNQVGIVEAFETRFDAVWKIFGKSDVVNKSLAMSGSGIVKSLLFKYRVAVLMGGLIGLFILIRKNLHFLGLPILLTALSMYFYFTIVIVHAEMRYLLVPDILISIFSGVAINEARLYFNQVMRPANE